MYIYMDMYLYMYRTRRHYSSSLWGCAGRQCVAVGGYTRHWKGCHRRLRHRPVRARDACVFRWTGTKRRASSGCILRCRGTVTVCVSLAAWGRGRVGPHSVAPLMSASRLTGASATPAMLSGGGTQARIGDAHAAAATIAAAAAAAAATRLDTFSERCLIIICIEHLGQRGALSRRGGERPRLVVMKDTRAAASSRGSGRLAPPGCPQR